MIAFFIELFIAGVLVTHLFANKLPDLFLAVTSPLIGFIVYFINFLVLLVFRIQVSLTLLTVLIGVEIILLLGIQLFLNSKRRGFHLSLIYLYMLVGVLYFGLLWIFTKINYSYATNDSLYILIMSHNLLATGLSKFYFLSPAGNGMLVAILQTIGMLFGQDYTWSIQPIISIFFFVLFLYFASRSLRAHKVKWWMILVFLTLITGVTLSSNLMTVFSTYIHTNLDSGIFLALALISLLYAENEKNDFWLFFTAVFIFTFAFTRVENILFIFVLIIACLADGKIESKKVLKIFLPGLLAQLFWFYIIGSLQSDAFTDQLTPSMIKIMIVCIVFVILLLFVFEKKFIKTVFQKCLFKTYPFILVLLFVGLFLFQWPNTLTNFINTSLNLFFAGQWFGLWWFISITGLILFLDGPKILHEPFYIFLITTFFTTVYLLGAFRSPYHLGPSDSANRMMVHILPVLLYYLIEKIGLIVEQTNNTRLLILQDSQK